jgi:hypothetical protein
MELLWDIICGSLVAAWAFGLVRWVWRFPHFSKAAKLKRAMAKMEREQTKGKREFVERLRELDNLSDSEKVAARLAWLERKTVEVLWLIVGVIAMLAGILVASIASDVSGSQSFWLKVPVFLFAWLIVGWWSQRRIFEGLLLTSN